MTPPLLLRVRGRRHWRRLVTLLAASAVAASLLSVPSTPASAVAEPATGGVPDATLVPLPGEVEPVAVTLITGDTVLWYDAGDGSPRVEVERAPRDHPVIFDQSGTQEDFYVIPSDVMEHVVAGTVDRELFNIPGLIRQGLDDASTDELPVIVTFDHDSSTGRLARDAGALPATGEATAVDKLNGAGVTVNRGKAGTFRDAVFGKPGRDHYTRTAGARGLDGAVEKIMLDPMLEIDLAESVPQIGAPHAWDAGYTGEGVTVAVLDTGVDATHPDLAGQVVANANFTDEPGATDTHGHGTHVASTIAGTGAASDGARRGVAPDAELLSGKVCNSDGRCRTSDVMAAMEWATAQGADVVNLSLGSRNASDGTDPQSQLVNQLSAETGALFVTSAGNEGRFSGLAQVGTPAAADAALAVGAVDKSDQMADFSSRGPRLGDHAVKPEITAPGVSIVAARAEGTSVGDPVDDDYTSLGGTSMAAPHVAGAAALLAQANPDLTGAELKDMLVSTAADGGHPWFEQGAGRVDVPAALESPVYAPGTVHFADVDGQPEQELIYSNRSDSDITLALDIAVTNPNGKAIDGVSLSTDTVTVPARGQAAVTLEVDASAVPGTGPFGGAVTATGLSDVALRTGIGFGPPMHRVTIEVLDSKGDHIGSDTAADRFVRLTHDTLDREIGGADVYSFRTVEGIATGLVPTGTYTILTDVPEVDSDAGWPTRRSVLVEVEVEIKSDVTFTLDARDAMPIEVSVHRKTEKRNHQVAVFRELVGSGGDNFMLSAYGGSWPVYATPTPPGELAPLRLFVSWTLAEPLLVQPIFGQRSCPQLPFMCYSEAPAYVYNLPILYENGIPGNLHERIARRDLVEVPSRFHSDHPDAFIRQEFGAHLPFFTGASPGQGSNVEMWFRPGKVAQYFLADDSIAWVRRVRIERRPEVGPTQSGQFFSDDRFPAAEAGGRRSEERWFEAPMRIGVWDVREESLDWPRDPAPRVATAVRGGLEGDQFTVPSHAMGNTRGHAAEARLGASWRMWNSDTGTELEPSGKVFPLASEEATYRLEQIENYPSSYPFLTGPATTTWRFASRPSDVQVPQRYKCWLRQAPRQDICQIQPLILLEYDLGLDIHNRVPAGRAHVFTITAGHHSKAIDHAPVTSLRVQASFDGGETWQENVIGRARGRDTWDTGGFLPSAEPYQQFRVVLKIPPLHRTTGYVTLRVRAEDMNGGTVEQTIHRAYLLK